MQPVIIEDNISIAANSVNQNVIVSNASLRRYLRSPFPARGRLIASQSAAGLTIDLDYGSKNVVASANPWVGTDIFEPQQTVNNQWWCNEGDQLVLRASNNTAGALSLRYRIVLDPVDYLEPDVRVMMQGPTAIAAAAVDVQLLDGLRYERPPVDSLLTVFMAGSATGLLRQLYVDTDSISPPAAVNPSNRIPNDPFDVTIDGVEVPRDKLIALSVSNPTGGALNVFWKIALREMVRT